MKISQSQAQREAYRPSLTKVVFYSPSAEVRYIVILLSQMPSQVKFVNGAVLMCYWCKYITSTRNHYFWFNILERSKFPVTVIDMKNKCIGLAHWKIHTKPSLTVLSQHHCQVIGIVRTLQQGHIDFTLSGMIAKKLVPSKHCIEHVNHSCSPPKHRNKKNKPKTSSTCHI
jgi:hypothetical protein